MYLNMSSYWSIHRDAKSVFSRMVIGALNSPGLSQLHVGNNSGSSAQFPVNDNAADNEIPSTASVLQDDERTSVSTESETQFSDLSSEDDLI